MRLVFRRLIVPAVLSLALSSQQAISREEGSTVEPQRATFFFQESGEARGEEFPATVEWSQTSRDGALAIHAVTHLPQQNATVGVTIYRNADRSLPARHMVEILVAGDLASSPIRSIPGIARRANEAAPSDRFDAIAFAVTEHLFWIALRDDSQRTEVQNLQLLRYGYWFDVPIVFRDGSRAMLTLERGEAGAEIFETVIGAWRN